MTSNRLFLVGTLIALLIWTVIQFLGMGAGGSFELWGFGRATAALEILAVIYLVLWPTAVRQPSRVMLIVICWIPLVLLNAALSSPGELAEWALSGVLPVLLWPLMFLLFCGLARRDSAALGILERYFLGFSVVCVGLFFAVFSSVNSGRSGRLLQLNAIYYPLLTLPWVASVRRPVLRYIGMLLVVLAVSYSLKRTALLALIVGGGAYALVELSALRRHRIRKAIPVVAVLLIAGVAYARVNSMLDETFSERLRSAREDGGSGRIAIYLDVWESLRSADAVNLVLGHGHYSSLSQFGVTAHNDFLEVLFDYGLLGLLLYVFLHASLIGRCIELVKEQSPLAPAYASAYGVFLVMSMVSHLIIYPTYFIPLVAYWGTVEGITRRQRQVRSLRQQHALAKT